MDELIPACPYCGVVLERPPKRAVKCPSCGGRIRVRSSCDYFDYRCLTEAQLLEAQLAEVLRSVDITNEAFRRESAEFTARGGGWTFADAAWSLLQAEKRKRANAADWGPVFGAEAEMLLRTGRDHRPAMREFYRCNALALKASGSVVAVEILPAPECCEGCERIAGRRYTLDEVIRDPPLPCRECIAPHGRIDNPYPWCRCDWLMVLECEEAGDEADSGNAEPRPGGLSRLLRRLLGWPQQDGE